MTIGAALRTEKLLVIQFITFI